MNLKQKQYFVYVLRYEGDNTACKIGKSSTESFWGRTAPARTWNYREIEILGIQLCNSEADALTQEKYLRDERFERVRPDREWIKLTHDVWEWIKTDCIENPPQLKDFDVSAKHKQGDTRKMRNIKETARQQRNRAIEKLKEGEYESAIEGFDAAIESRPNDDKIYFNRGIAYYELYEETAAISDFDEAIRLNPDLAEAYLYRGKCKSISIIEEQHAETISDFDKPDLAEAYVSRGNEKRAVLEDYEGAISDFDEAIRLNPADANAYLYRAFAKSELEQYAAAISDFDMAIHLNPDNDNAYYHRGVAKFYLNRREEAKQDFLTAKQLIVQTDNTGNTGNIFRVEQYLYILN